jgi:membrane protein implicated in regulation of membrane protease activity
MTKVTIQNIGVAALIAIGVFVVLVFLLGFPSAILGSVILAVVLAVRSIRSLRETKNGRHAR